MQSLGLNHENQKCDTYLRIKNQYFSLRKLVAVNYEVRLDIEIGQLACKIKMVNLSM